MHVEVTLTQLVFEHSLRIRLNAPVEKEKDDSSKVTKAVPVDQPTTGQAPPERHEAEVSTSTLVTDSMERETSASGATINDEPSGTEGPAAEATESKKPEKALVGTMMNLITTDLGIMKTPSGYLLDIR